MKPVRPPVILETLPPRTQTLDRFITKREVLDYTEKHTLLTILGGVSVSTLSRLVKEDGFPVPEKLGNRLYYKTSLIFEWISLIAGREVAIGDVLLSSKQLEKLFARSTVWVWYTFQKTARKELSIKIRSRPYWLESEVLLDPELRQHLSLINNQKIGGTN